MDQLKKLFTYDQWANRKTAAVLNDQPSNALPECNNLFAHIAAAQKIWYNRVIGKPTNDIELWPEHVLVSVAMETLEMLHAKWTKLLDSANYEAVVSYANSKGKEFKTPLAGILHHIIIHGQHHRAQIAMLLRQGGINPPASDFIFYLRENGNDN